MRCRTTVVLAAIALCCAAAPSGAQVQSPDIAPFDPPEKEYFTGAQEPDPQTERGLPIAAPHRAFLPDVVDLSGRMPAVGDQGRSSSCAAWSTAYAARSYYTAALERRDVLRPANLPSPSYVYHLARDGKCEDGTTIPRVVEVLKHGALSLEQSPFTAACVAPASPQLVAQANDFRVRGMGRVDVARLDDIKGQLARSNPVIIRLQVSTAFQHLRGTATFDEPAPPPGDKLTGWHFITLVGYDERRQVFRLINSWGTGWGDRGYAWLGYDVLRTRVTHAYTLDVAASKPPAVVTTVSPPKPPPPPSPPVPKVTPPPVITKVVPPPPVVAPPPTPVKVQPVVPPPMMRPGVALVIGNSAYAGAPLATTAADAGAIAETMRAAGYNVTELHDVRQADIGTVLRSFLDQVAAAGPDSVAFFYFAGLAARSGEHNFLVPVDATITGRNDVALQALRLDDLVAELTKVPAAARIIVLDAARDHGYGRGTPDLVPPGLANMAAPAGTTIAFPAAPGHIAEDGSGPYSLYTKTLVTLMRQAGLDIDRIFKTTRLQVNATTQGRQTPWTAEGLTVDVTLFPASPQQGVTQPPPPVAPPAVVTPPAPVTPVQVTPVQVTPAQVTPPSPGPGLRLADLENLSCGRVTAQPRGGRSVLSGFVASDEDLKLVQSIATNVPHTSLGDVIVAPWPQCEALQTLEKPLGLPDRPTIDIGPKLELRGGDALNIQIRSPSQMSYLYVAYIQADGSVVDLVQPAGLVPQPTLPRQTLMFGGGQSGKPKFTISPPFGREMIIAIASRSPLFDHELPAQQTEREFLSDLRRALLYKPAPDMPDRELTATIKTLQTRPR
jgi:Caspase domain/Papain family cysteine protease/Domain of unknown function (DUF4384)